VKQMLLLKESTTEVLLDAGARCSRSNSLLRLPSLLLLLLLPLLLLCNLHTACCCFCLQASFLQDSCK
jgi:hypothetical protein